MLFLFNKHYISKVAYALHSIARSLFLLTAISSLFWLPNTYAAEGLFGGDRVLEPRLKSQIEEEEKRKREQQRKALEKKQAQEAKAKQRYYYGKTDDEKSKEQKEYEENKQYMTYWQRFKHGWQYAENIQDIFDLSLSKAYAPARVTSAFLNIQSGPGRNYPVIYIAERDELIDFYAIRTEWYQIRTSDGHFGWVHMDELPKHVKFDIETQGFADEAKTIATRGTLVDVGVSGGILSEDPVLSLFVRNRNTYFISTELEMGVSRGVKARNDFISANVLAHPFNDLAYRPYFLLGLGQMHSEYRINNLLTREDNMFAKAGLGISKNLGGRMRFRADLSQYAVESDIPQLNHFSQISVGTSFIWGSSTDPVLNRSIGEKVGVSDLELTLFSGSVVLSHADTVSNTGLRLSYHISEDYFFEGHASSGSEDYQHLGVAIGRNLFSSEYILKWRDNRNFWPTQLYAIAGTGVQHIDEDEQVTVSLGAGFRINPTRHWAIRIDGRQHIVHQQIFNNTLQGKYLKNPELSFGLSYFF